MTFVTNWNNGGTLIGSSANEIVCRCLGIVVCVHNFVFRIYINKGWDAAINLQAEQPPKSLISKTISLVNIQHIHKSDIIILYS